MITGKKVTKEEVERAIKEQMEESHMQNFEKHEQNGHSPEISTSLEEETVISNELEDNK